MKFLFSYYTHKPGGFCTRLYRGMSACVSAGHTVIYATLDTPPVKLDGVQVLHIPFPLATRRGVLFWGLFTLWLPWYLLYVTARYQPDRLVPFGAFYAASMWVSGVLFKKPRILFLRSITFKIDEVLGKPTILRLLAKAVDAIGVRTATSVVCMTKVMQREVALFSGRDMTDEPMLINDIPPQLAFDRCEDTGASSTVGELLCVAAGVLDARKNISVLVNAMVLCARARAASPNIRLMVFGDGVLLEGLNEQRERLGLGDVIKFQGWVSDPTAVLQSNALLLHPALHEGVPNIVMEALGRGLPVALSNIPEHVELVSYSGDHGDDRVPLLDPNRAEDWAAFLERYRDDSGFRERVISSSRHLATSLRFDWDGRFVEIVTASLRHW